MYIKSMVLEGFKSYGKRIEINGFDREFNAITGFNGSGKSNILDGICFVLGITNLGQVRATSLQDLVYKSGQAGVKKASVTITFDNRDVAGSPMGYEKYEEITVTRQVVIGGKNKYMINGSNAPNKKVQDMFCSVQLNVNNPHFLIMQGRITKVLNMKPAEILSMIEEAAGTRMYETKKAGAIKTIEKKESKLNEIETVLQEEIGPKLAKLKEEKMQFVEFQRIERELEHCKRICVAWKYITALKDSENVESTLQNLKDKINSMSENITTGEQEIRIIEEKFDELSKKKDSESGGKLSQLQKELKESETQLIKITAEVNSNAESIKASQKAFNQLQENVKDDEKTLQTKEKGFEKVADFFNNLKEAEQIDSQALAAAQEKYQKISAGLLQNDAGENATLEQQVIIAKQSATQAQTELKQCEMALRHNETQLKKKSAELKTTEGEYAKYSRDLEDKQKTMKNIQNELNKLNYQEGTVEDLKQNRHTLMKELRQLKDQLDSFESKHPQTRFDYHKPDPSFNPKSVKGLVCKLITVKDQRAFYALDVAAGGKLYNVIVDTELTSKKVLQNGRLQRRVTIIPLNKVNGKPMDNRMISLAQKLVGPENVQPALSLIDFPEETRPAMTWVFGQIFICKDMDAATKVAFHEGIKRKCVTLEGDVVDPAGTLSGGAASKTGSILLKLEELKHVQNEVNEKESAIRNIDNTLAGINEIMQKYTSLKEKYDLHNYEIGIVKQRFEQTVHHKIKEEVDKLQSCIEELKERMEAAQKLEKENTKRAKELECQLKDAANIRDKQLKQAENELEALKKKAENSRKEWQKREREAETLKLEIQELKKSIEAGKEQLVKAETNLNDLKQKANDLKKESENVKSATAEAQEKVEKQKNIINKQNAEMQKLAEKKEDIVKQNKETELEIKKLNHEVTSITKSASAYKQKVADLQRKYDWIEQEKAYFGKAGGIYDFSVNNPDEVEQKVQRLQTTRDKLSRCVNTRAISLLDKEEEQFNDMLKKKKIVENDKKKIFETIKHLDKKKKETIMKAWEQVNKDFGSIFSTLLPGAQAKLEPPENQTVIDGLEVKVGFSGIWKESLGELSGGQRSLVALSLILAMLLFKPAPLYILDEVDAALDLSHTENIGTMLKKHFKRSQFVVVSLKDGMFNNANVLFTTKFVDGMSTVTRKGN